MSGGIVVILIAIGAFSLSEKETSFSQILSVGPVWNTDSWLCTSDADFMVYGALRGLEGSLLEVRISNIGTQSLYALEAGHLEHFTVGAIGGEQVIVTRTGIVTGFITLHTLSDAEANCVPL